ncbi:GntP family permease [Pleomorphovibrio marinus]|uniref:GntP family permease n=1 Tax=Pleomorphovibrio marinus TaxID=2164132 RepID=UPI000E0B830D|nr:SLC13 family permease [Pleomorphovibrio marinus]
MTWINDPTTWPFLVLLLSVILVVFLITKAKFHPFIALILAAIFVGFLTPELPTTVMGEHAWVTAVELPMVEFGIVAGKIAWVIALAAVIGAAMMESGAAAKIVNVLLQTMGEKRAAFALVIAGFILSIPVFLDTVFFLLIPLGITLAQKTGKNFVLYVVAIGGGGVITHSLVPPTPGPLIMAETMQLDLGLVIVFGLLAGIIPAIAVILTGKWQNRTFDIPLRVASNPQKPIQRPPSLLLSLLPIVLPLIMISLASVVAAFGENVPAWVALQGNKNIAMTVGTLLALYIWARAQGLTARELWEGVSRPLEIGGLIILITSAGGAYGAMIGHSGIGDAIKNATEGFQVHYIVLAWLIAAVFKTAQGSGTVAMISAASIMAAIVGTDVELPYHPIYLLLAMGFGSLFISWMNDSGFWVVSKMSGFSEKEGLQTWTLVLAVIGLVGLAQVLIVAKLFPMI